MYKIYNACLLYKYINIALNDYRNKITLVDNKPHILEKKVMNLTVNETIYIWSMTFIKWTQYIIYKKRFYYPFYIEYGSYIYIYKGLKERFLWADSERYSSEVKPGSLTVKSLILFTIKKV